LREPIDLGQLARDVVASLAILAEERHQQITMDIPDRVVVTVDRLVVREAIANVVDNAIKYSPPQSRIDVRVSANRDQAYLDIADQGAGVPAEHRTRVFDRFFRIDEGRSRDRGGTGLGLAIAKWAVDVNGGHISVEEGRNGGTFFRITLPLTESIARGGA